MLGLLRKYKLSKITDIKLSDNENLISYLLEQRLTGLDKFDSSISIGYMDNDSNCIFEYLKLSKTVYINSELFTDIFIKNISYDNLCLILPMWLKHFYNIETTNIKQIENAIFIDIKQRYIEMKNTI